MFIEEETKVTVKENVEKEKEKGMSENEALWALLYRASQGVVNLHKELCERE